MEESFSLLVSFLLLLNSNSQSSSVYRGGGPLAVEEFFPLCLCLFLLVFSTPHPFGEGPSGLLWGAKAPVVASSAVASHCPLLMRSTGFSKSWSSSVYRGGGPLAVEEYSLCLCLFLLLNSNSQSSSVYRGGVPLAVEEYFLCLCLFFSF